MELAVFSNVAQIVEAATVIGGTAFALFQLSEIKKQRRNAVAAELMRAFMDAEFTKAMGAIQRVPDTALTEDLHDINPDLKLAAMQIGTTFEIMGLMVFRRIAPFDLVVDLAGGITVVMWLRLEPLCRHIREEQSQPSFAEWFQWLAEQCQKHKDEGAPAYRAHAGWKPPPPGRD